MILRKQIFEYLRKLFLQTCLGVYTYPTVEPFRLEKINMKKGASSYGNARLRDVNLFED